MSTHQEIVVGVDLGTTDTKVALTTVDGVTIGSARRPTDWAQDAAGRLETTGDSMVATALATVADALAAARERTGDSYRVLSVGIAGLAESGVVLDRDGRELSPVIAWFDERGGAELRALDPDFVRNFPRRTGLPVGSQWTLPKLLWMRSAGLELRSGQRWLNIPELLAWTLCGEQVSEPSLASRTGLIDQSSGRVWDEAAAQLGVPSDFLPPTQIAGQPAGRIAHCSAVPELAGAVVTVAGHDHPVAAVGAGASGPEDLFDSCGTAEVLLRVVPRLLGDGERATLVGLGIDAGTHVIPEQSVLIGGMRSGLVMRRVLALIGASAPAARDEVDRRWAPTARTADSVVIAGAAIHDNDVTIRLRDGASPDLAWAATLAHLAEQTSSLLAGIGSVVGEHRSAVAAGGWTRMRSVRETKLATIPRLTFCPVDQPGTRGAALFAACAALDEPRIEERARRFAATVDTPTPASSATDMSPGRPEHNDRLTEGLTR